LEYILPLPQLAPFYPDTWIALAIALNGRWQALDQTLTLYRIHDANRSDPAGKAWQAARKARSGSAALRNSLLAEELLQRSIAADPAKRKMVEEFASHHRQRSLYSKNIFIRLVQAVKELLKLHYRKYSNNWRTFIADILFKP
jgi:hypothetical protein